MDRTVSEKDSQRKVVDITKPHLRQFFECEERPGGGEAKRGGFWKPFQHGLKVQKEK